MNSTNLLPQNILWKLFDINNNDNNQNQVIFPQIMNHLTVEELKQLRLLNRSFNHLISNNERFKCIRSIFLGLQNLPLFLGVRSVCGAGHPLASYLISPAKETREIVEDLMQQLAIKLGIVDPLEIDITEYPREWARLEQIVAKNEQQVSWSYEGKMDLNGRISHLTEEKIPCSIIYRERIGQKGKGELKEDFESKQPSVGFTLKAIFDHMKHMPLLSYNKTGQTCIMLRLDSIELISISKHAKTSDKKILKDAIASFNQFLQTLNLKKDEDYFASLDESLGKLEELNFKIM